MYGYDAIKTPDQVTRMADGAIACPQHHGRQWSYRIKTLAPATSVWIVFNYSAVATGVVFVCKRHTGTIKAQQSKGSHGWDSNSVRLIENATLEEVAANPKAFMDAATKTREDEKRQAEDSRLQFIRRNWDAVRYDALTRVSVVKVNHTAVDEYGVSRVNVYLTHAITPAIARQLAADLIKQADKAEALTRAQERP